MWMVLGMGWLWAATTVSPESLLQQVERSYQQAGHLEASFVQVYEDVALERKQQESGRMWVSQAGQVHWLYEQPERKQFVFDGTNAFFYEPSQQQVTVFDDFSATPLALTLQLLWGKGERKRMFRYQACQADCPEASKTWVGHWLYPKEAMAQVERVCLYTNSETQRITLVVLYDALDNRNSYRFDNIVLGKAMPAEHFVFAMPEHVHLLRAQIPSSPTPPAAKSPNASPSSSPSLPQRK